MELTGWHISTVWLMASEGPQLRNHPIYTNSAVSHSLPETTTDSITPMLCVRGLFPPAVWSRLTGYCCGLPRDLDHMHWRLAQTRLDGVQGVPLQFSKSDASGFFLSWRENQAHWRADLGVSPGLNCYNLTPGSSTAMEPTTRRDSEVTGLKGTASVAIACTTVLGCNVLTSV